MQIGIAITTVPQRADLHATQMEAFSSLAPTDAFIYVHNDWRGIGIARSKNNCLKALYEAGCEHFFLFDDDIYPIAKGWEQAFIESKQKHLCLTWSHRDNGEPMGHKLFRSIGGLDYFTSGCGVLLYFTRDCIDRIGGFETAYEVWGYEHTGLSHRIKNAGLITSTHISPSKACDMFWIADKIDGSSSLFTQQEKNAFVSKSQHIARGEASNADWKPFRKADYVLTSLYSGIMDEQRRRTGRFTLDAVKTLADSAPCEVVCFTNIKPRPSMQVRYVHSDPRGHSMYNYRFIHWHRWLKKNIEYCEVVYLLDATDTEFIGTPQKIERGKVYINTEGERGNVAWLLNEGGKVFSHEVLTARGTDIWNAGVIYGYAEDVLALLELMQPYLLKSKKMIEMSALNYLCNSSFPCVAVKSGFKSGDKDGVWIRHK